MGKDVSNSEYLHDFYMLVVFINILCVQCFFFHIDTVLFCLNSILYSLKVPYIYGMYINHFHPPLPPFNFP